MGRKGGKLVPAFGVSVASIVFTLTIAQILRKVVSKVQRPFLRILLEEFIAAAELCACCFELVIIADNYGIWTYAVFLFLLTIWWSKRWGDATACPYLHLESWVEGSSGIQDVIFKTLAEVIGGVIIFKYIQVIWAMEYASTHKGRAFAPCTADLQVSVFLGALIEGAATLFCRLSSRAVSELEPRFGSAIESFIGTSLVVAAFNLSGGYFNPVLATSLKFGCKGHTATEFAIVYWVGASMGAVLSVFLWKIPGVRSMFFVSQLKEKVE